MQLASSLAIGAAGGAAAFSFFGNPDRPVEDRLAMGAMVGAGIGAVAGTEAGRRGALLAGELSRHISTSHALAAMSGVCMVVFLGFFAFSRPLRELD